MALYLKETLTFDRASMMVESIDEGHGKNLYMKGIFIQGGVKNANERVYPVNEIERAVKTLNEQITTGHSVLGEVDHPDDLKINLDRVSHMITNMWMDGANGFGKLKILPTPMGKLVETMYSRVQTQTKSYRADRGEAMIENFEQVTRKNAKGELSGAQRVDSRATFDGRVYKVYVLVRLPLGANNVLQTKRDQADAALVVVRETLDKFMKEGVTEAELKAAKQNLVGGFPMRIDSNGKILDYLALIGFYKLPLDYLDTFNDNVNKVTAAQIKEAFNRRIQTDKMVTVIVGAQ